jgi:pimeloyl-ACP methyl ester carboxylesterase
VNPAQRPQVVLVHGLWFGAWSLALLARRLRLAGFDTRHFRYRTTRYGLDAHAHALRTFVGDPGPRPLHFVAHSLGGLVTLQMLADNPGVSAGRVVLLSSPLRGSTVARKAARLPGGGRLLGAVQEILDSGFPSLAVGCEIGMIAGSRAAGLGLLLGGPGGPGDGTVAVTETRAEILRDHLVLPVTHTGMLFSRQVVNRTVRFLRTGSFNGAP